ncbi:putative protein [BD1-7 clade bacterium]|uniref:SnoaL-like domain-containing protein n=1 Tax=BD1-7 clade bacterium TaxID=2029982 RepID=A0A5S9QZZ6_9GAMM|nr:putative protein [BD1-7 clade bacterium]
MKYSLQQISDRLEIEDLLVEYSDAVDTLELDRLDNVFTPDAFIDYSPLGGAMGTYTEVKQFLKNALPAFKNTQHMISNFRIQLDGDRASGKVMCFNPMELDMGDGSRNNIFFVGLWYIDEYIRSADGWKISSRREEKSYDYNTPEFIQFSSF